MNSASSQKKAHLHDLLDMAVETLVEHGAFPPLPAGETCVRMKSSTPLNYSWRLHSMSRVWATPQPALPVENASKDAFVKASVTWFAPVGSLQNLFLRGCRSRRPWPAWWCCLTFQCVVYSYQWDLPWGEDKKMTRINQRHLHHTLSWPLTDNFSPMPPTVLTCCDLKFKV